jgi:ribonuclease D
MDPLKKPLYITTTSDLAAFCRSLKQSNSFVAIDTEFIRERTYYPHLCLIQVAGKEETAVIDCLEKEVDLSPLLDLLYDPTLYKVLHSAGQYLEIFYFLMGKLPQNIYDTQVAAMVCGFGESVGYETLVSQLLKESLDKSLRVSNWAHRPLSDKQIAYAVGDVVYLRDVYEKLSQSIEQQNRQSWIEEEMEELLNEEIYQPNLERLLHRLGLKSRHPHVWARAYHLLKLREQLAQESDKPRPSILRDDVIIDLAYQNPLTQEDIQKVRGLFDKPAHYRLPEQTLKAMSDANALPEDQCPKLPKAPNKTKAHPMVVEALKVLLKHVSKEHKVAERLIASATELEELTSTEKRERSHLLKGWRHEIFGKLALQFLQGQCQIACKNNQLIFTSLLEA